MAELAKTVLLLHQDNEQGNIWKLILTLRGLDVIWEPANDDLVNLLEKFQAARASLPSLLLVDLGLKSSDKEYSKAISICHWCMEHHPRLKVILINYVKNQIAVTQKSWAVSQGAIDLLPDLKPETLVPSINRISKVLDLQPLQSPFQENFLKQSTPVLASRKNSNDTTTEKENDNPSSQRSDRLDKVPTELRPTFGGKWVVPVLVLGLVTGGGYLIWRSFLGGNFSKASGAITVMGNSFSGHSTFRSVAFQETLKQTGIDLHYQVESEPRSAELLNQGKADLELTTLDEFLQDKPQGKIVGLINHSRGADAVILNTKRYPGLKTLPDLARLVQEARSQGQQLEVVFPENTPSEYLALLLSTKFEGFKLADFQIKKVANVDEDWKLLQDPNQNVAVAVLREPDVTQARLQGYTVVLSSQDVPEEIVDVIIASDRLLQSHPEEVSKLLEAYYRRVDTDVRDASHLKRQIAEDAKLSPADAVTLLQGIEFFTAMQARGWLKSGELEKRLSSTAAVLTLSGKIDRVPQSPEDLFASGFVERAASNTEKLISLVRATNPKLADKLAGKEQLVTSDRPLNVNQSQTAPVIGNLKVQWNVQFDSNSVHLTSEGKKALNHLAQEIADEFNPQTVAVRVIGHTSSNGSPDANQKLSQQRAQVVVDYFQSLGLKHLFIAEGKGSTESLSGISSNDLRNQRTEIRLIHIN